MASDPRHDPNADARGWPDDSFSADLGHGIERTDTDAAAAGRVPHDHETVPPQVDRESLTILEPGTVLDEGSVYVDLDRLADGPFRALGGQRADTGTRLVSKKDVDYALWNGLVGRDAVPRTIRPEARGAGGRED